MTSVCLPKGRWPAVFSILIYLIACGGQGEGLIREARADESPSGDWGHWMGPARNGHSPGNSGYENGMWPPSNPLWKTKVGSGSTSPLVVDGVLYTVGWASGKDTVVALNAETGEPVWSQSYPGPEYGRNSTGDKGMYKGVSATPEFDPGTGFLYTLSCDGDLHCWDTGNKGAKIWHVNLYDKYKVPRRPQVTDRRGSLRDYGYTSAPLVVGNHLLVEVGSPTSGNLIGFDKRTGAELWKSQNRDPAGHAGGMAPMVVEGVPCVAVFTARHLLVVRLDAGRVGHTVAEFPWVTDFINSIATPAVSGNRVVVTSRYNQQAAACVEVTLRGARQVWRSDAASGVCSPVIHAGHLHWANKGVHCVDLATGKLKWKGGTITDAGSCIVTGDGRMIVWGNGGDLFLCETAQRSPDAYLQLAEKKRIFNDMAWPHVVLADGLLYVKDTSGNLACFSLRPQDKDKGITTVRVDPVIPPEGSPNTAGPVKKPSLESWPGESRGLFFAWKSGWGKAKVAGSFAAANPRVRMQTRGAADTNPEGDFALSRGAAFMPALDTPLLEAIRGADGLTLEAVFTPADSSQSGPARIISYSKDGYHRNFTLGQEREKLVLRLRTTQTGENGMNPETSFGAVEGGRPVHLVVTYSANDLRAYMDGKEVLRTDRVKGTLTNWEPMHFVLGDEWSDTRDWAGSISALAIWPRALEPEEAASRFQLAK